jgi:hypothetical protein
MNNPSGKPLFLYQGIPYRGFAVGTPQITLRNTPHKDFTSLFETFFENLPENQR